MIKINMGCGTHKFSGYINIDKYPKDNDVIKADMANTGYSENTIDWIYCSHVIEHVTPKHLIKSLKHWYHILKPSGKVEILCPNAIQYLQELVKAMKQGNVSYCQDWGTRNITGHYERGTGMFNRNYFNFPILEHYLKQAKFNIEIMRLQETRVKNKKDPHYRKHGDIYCLARKPS